jgi:hypothetical protein
MKPTLLVALLGAVLLTGCARHYTITLTNGNRITTLGKPHLQGATYYFKDVKGQPGYISSGRVREIAPAGQASSRMSSGFSAAPQK